MVRNEPINTVLAIAATEDLRAENVDVNTAFLDGGVEEEIYMDQPDSFKDERSPTKKCLLHKALYGTKQEVLDVAVTLMSTSEIHPTLG